MRLLAAPPSRRRLPAWLPWAIAAVTTLALLATAAVAVTSFRRPMEPRQPVRFQVTPPGKATTFSATANFLALSPDGRHLAFVSANDAGTPVLWVRSLTRSKPVIAGTEGARQPFWSPDSLSIAYFAFGTLRKVAASGGPQQMLSEAPAVPTGGAWGREGVILFSNLTGPITRVPATGGERSTATRVNQAEREDSHSYPHFLPDGRRFLYYVRSANVERAGIYVKSLDADDARRVMDAGSNVAYVPPGYPVYARNGVLMAQPFDRPGGNHGRPRPDRGARRPVPRDGARGVLGVRRGRARVPRLHRYGAEPSGLVRSPRQPPGGSRRATPVLEPAAVAIRHASGGRARGPGGESRYLAHGRRSWRAGPLYVRRRPRRGAGLVGGWEDDRAAGESATYIKDLSGTRREERVRDEPWIPDDWLPDGSEALCHPNSPLQIMIPSGDWRRPHASSCRRGPRDDHARTRVAGRPVGCVRKLGFGSISRFTCRTSRARPDAGRFRPMEVFSRSGGQTVRSSTTSGSTAG